MGSVEEACENTMVERFFVTLECKLIARRRWKRKAEAKAAVFAWIQGWYNQRQCHAALDHRSPVNFERSRAQQESVMQQPRPEHGLPTASVGSSQAPTAAVENPAALTPGA